MPPPRSLNPSSPRSPPPTARLRPRGWAAAPAIVLIFLPAAFAQDAAAQTDRIARLNQTFLEHVRNLDPAHALARTAILDAWEHTYRAELAESFVPDALAVLYPPYRDALAAFDEERAADVVRLLEPLRTHDDRFLAANADYFHVRALVALGRYEQVEAMLASLEARKADYAAHTPYAPHLWFINGFCQARNLRFEQAIRSLEALRAQFPDAPEAVRVGAAQLLLEVERRERGTLGEVATIMDYVADRLRAADRTQRVRERQQQIVAMLDRLIEEQRQQEQQQGGGGRQSSGKSQPSPGSVPGTGKDESDAPPGAGELGEQHAAPEADPGEMWGKLPPAERERILQSIRERFPSRYRQLVEQYYRALAEEK